MKHTRWAVGAVVLVTTLWAAPTYAYTIATQFSESCHEAMSLEAWLTTELPPDFVPLDIAIPEDDTWQRFAGFLEEAGLATFMEVDGIDPEGQRFSSWSIAAGARAPDTEGHSVANLETLRRAHTNPSGQYPHFLRGNRDDFQNGNEKAIDGSVKHFRDTIQVSLGYLQFPPEAQIIEVELYVDFYGVVEVEVWAPAYFLGVALHTLQDSFSHTIRSDDLFKIRHVLNFIEAVNTDHEPVRDGLAHSAAMDNCQDDANEIAKVARQASSELMLVLIDILSTGDFGFLDVYIERWFTYEPGCHQSNSFCDSKWASLAQRDPTGPFIGDIFACQHVGHGRRPSATALAFVLLFGGLVLARQRESQFLSRNTRWR